MACSTALATSPFLYSIQDQSRGGATMIRGEDCVQTYGDCHCSQDGREWRQGKEVDGMDMRDGKINEQLSRCRNKTEDE